ncbi:hypothetical protein CSOJ01_09335 [Colletotrichum sojae]|uniref:Methyltransferase domain-containing protein n=1 Tax=Colletotrichum sojae TaxID=2175907 RepID=A0A8H6J373_9PEZI|nr:hypothetical protein CSOJ01_09335 [Colletotrichum sojae]
MSETNNQAAAAASPTAASPAAAQAPTPASAEHIPAANDATIVPEDVITRASGEGLENCWANSLVSLQDDTDNESVLGGSVASSTTSVYSSVLQYRQENGRTYHSYKEGKYILPNDERENERLDIQHNMFILSFDGRLGTSPPTDPGSKVGRVLDIGTGTGVWAIDFADEHPEADILGVDLSAIQPSFAPPNVRFEIDDIEEPWTYSQPFDFIHSRGMTTSISNWKQYIKKCYDNLVPGGYLELTEIDLQPRSDDGTLKEDASLLLFSRLWGEACEKFGRPFFKDQSVLRDMMIEVGFESTHARSFKWPSSPWAKDPKYNELGQWNLDNMIPNLDGLVMAALTRGHDWSREEVTILAMNVRKEMTDPKIHSYSTM